MKPLSRYPTSIEGARNAWDRAEWDHVGNVWVKQPRGYLRMPKAVVEKQRQGYSVVVEVWPKDKAPKGCVWRWEIHCRNLDEAQAQVESCVRISFYWRRDD